jgi:hypothetical protein
VKNVTLAVQTLLKANAAIAAVVGTRVYRTLDPIPTKPFIAVARVDKVPEDPTSSATYSVARIQCTSFAATDVQAEEISDLISDAVQGVQDTVISGVYIVGIEDGAAIPDNSDGPTTGVWRDNHDLKITYQLR